MDLDLALGGSGARQRRIGNLLVRVHFIIAMIRWTGLAPWEFERTSILRSAAVARANAFRANAAL